MRNKKVYSLKKKMKNSSRRWLIRQINDPYVHKAKQEKYRSRSAFKLIQLNEKFNFLRQNLSIIDLGCAPGGWSQVIQQTVGDKSLTIGLDLKEMSPLQGIHFIKGDFLCPEIQKRLSDLSEFFDVILSDISPQQTGHKKTDHIQMMEIIQSIYIFEKNKLSFGGSLIFKGFQGTLEKELLQSLKKDFEYIKQTKPQSSRSESSEIYLVALKFIKNSAK
jgi:23S rRNA (uridine2552-2'-O)-methyltransferase